MRKLLLSLVLTTCLAAGASAEDQFTLAEYRTLRADDRPTLEFVLVAMYETVFYAQESVGGDVICATPMVVPGDELVSLVDRELKQPTNPDYRPYTDRDQVAFALLSALKSADRCR